MSRLSVFGAFYGRFKTELALLAHVIAAVSVLWTLATWVQSREAKLQRVETNQQKVMKTQSRVVTVVTTLGVRFKDLKDYLLRTKGKESSAKPPPLSQDIKK